MDYRIVAQPAPTDAKPSREEAGIPVRGVQEEALNYMVGSRTRLRVSNYRSLREVAFHSLRQAILSGDLKTGAPLVETELAREMGISTTPLREALRMLELEGLVRGIPHKGTFVTGLSEDDLKDACEVRAALESVAGYSAASKITPEQLAEMRSLLEQARVCIAERDFAAAHNINARFHHRIWEASGNRQVVGMLEMMKDRIHAISARLFRVPGQAEEGWRQHKEILDAIESGDALQARELLFRHILAMIPHISSSLDLERQGSDPRDPA